MPDAPVARSAAESVTTPSPTPDDAPSNPPSPTAVPNSTGSAAEFRGDNQHGSAQVAPTLGAPTNALVQISWDCFGFVFTLLCSFYLAVLHLRDWCWEAFGIKVRTVWSTRPFPASIALIYVYNEKFISSTRGNVKGINIF